MLNSITAYITSNIGNIVNDTVFAFIGIVLGFIFTPKDSNPSRSNETSKKKTLVAIKEIVIIKHSYKERSSKPQHSSCSSDNDFLIFVFIISIAAAYLYSKYHQEILNTFTGFTLMALASIITIAIKLYRNNNYDWLNKFWTVFMFVIIGFNLSIIVLMKGQDTTLTGDLSLVNKVLSYLAGLIFAIVPNIILLLVLVHLFALNSYLAKSGKLSSAILRKTGLFVKYPIGLSSFAVIYCIIAILFSSGAVNGCIQKQNEKNLELFTKSVYEQSK